MNSYTIIGIDPGLTGAIAVLCDRIVLIDMPTTAKVSGKGNEVNAYELCSIIREWGSKGETVVYVEKVTAMTGNGVTSSFSFGDSAGVVRAAVACAGLPVNYVTPQAWKKHFGLINTQKDAARTKAIQLFPSASSDLARKKDGGRADALLIARYGRDSLGKVSQH